MKFFEGLSHLLSDEQSVTITVRKNKDKTLTISIIPKIDVDDKAFEKLKPLNANGTPEQMDIHLINQIQEPLTMTMSLAQQVKDYEKHVKEIEKETKMKDKERKDGEATADAALKLVNKWIEKKQYSKSIAKLEEIKKAGYRKSAIDKKLKEIKDIKSKEQKDLFTGPPPPENTDDKTAQNLIFDVPGPSGISIEDKDIQGSKPDVSI